MYDVHVASDVLLRSVYDGPSTVMSSIPTAVNQIKEMSAALAVIRVHVLPLVPIARSQANVCRTTTNIYTNTQFISL